MSDRSPIPMRTLLPRGEEMVCPPTVKTTATSVHPWAGPALVSPDTTAGQAYRAGAHTLPPAPAVQSSDQPMLPQTDAPSSSARAAQIPLSPEMMLLAPRVGKYNAMHSHPAISATNFRFAVLCCVALPTVILTVSLSRSRTCPCRVKAKTYRSFRSIPSSAFLWWWRCKAQQVCSKASRHVGRGEGLGHCRMAPRLAGAALYRCLCQVDSAKVL